MNTDYAGCPSSLVPGPVHRTQDEGQGTLLACPHQAAYVRPDGTAVCLDCAAVLPPGAEAWQAPAVAYCAPGLHQWGPPHAADHPRQCVRCPAVEQGVRE